MIKEMNTMAMNPILDLMDQMEPMMGQATLEPLMMDMTMTMTSMNMKTQKI